MAVQVLYEIVRQHAEMAAFLWTVYDRHLQYPEENKDLDEIRVARLVERIEAHLDGLRVAGVEGMRIARERLEEFPDMGEAFVVRMLNARSRVRVIDLDAVKVRERLSRDLALIARKQQA